MRTESKLGDGAVPPFSDEPIPDTTPFPVAPPLESQSWGSRVLLILMGHSSGPTLPFLQKPREGGWLTQTAQPELVDQISGALTVPGWLLSLVTVASAEIMGQALRISPDVK